MNGTAASIPSAVAPDPVSIAIDIEQWSVMCNRDQAIAFAHAVLDPYGIPVPDITIGNVDLPVYHSPGRVDLTRCATPGDEAHELGHYVMDRANGMRLSAHLADAAAHFANGGWIKGQEVAPGVEYAAHCIGHQLYGTTAFTQCPNAEMARSADQVISRAG